MAETIPRGAATPEQMVRAKALMEDALRLLDEAGAAADIGAHLDTAIHRLTEEIDRN